MNVFSYRYLWQIDGNENICFKIVTDTENGLKQFETSLLALEGLIRASKEYLHEYDCSKCGVFEKIYDKQVNDSFENKIKEIK